ncbi:hypothetical protein ACFQ0X_12835 [Streptomyces rectiviolaceus]|uniref:hypothetical protein n=1 Tax=Streptomyces rectiviolaceus TaxID=332591 RepID=UPI0031CF0F9C
MYRFAISRNTGFISGDTAQFTDPVDADRRLGRPLDQRQRRIHNQRRAFDYLYQTPREGRQARLRWNVGHNRDGAKGCSG